MIRLFLAALALLAVPAPLLAQSLTLTNLKPAVAPLCPGVASVRTIAAFWRELAACTAKPDPAPPHEHAKPGDVGLRELIPSNVPASAAVIEGLRLPGPSGSDEGAVRFTCMTLKHESIDPLVFAGRKNVGHMHRFMGNTAVDENSTYETLRTTGSSTCQGVEHYRSALWVPALIDQDGKYVVPDADIIYYKRYRADSPKCKAMALQGCAPLPTGLTAIFGTNYATSGKPSPGIQFDCSGRNPSSTIAEAMRDCKTGERFNARVAAPQCWDGKRTGASDHQAHLAYAEWNRAGQKVCPPTHPVLIPQITITSQHTLQPGDRPATWLYASDVMAGTPGGVTYHADYMAAQEPSFEARWHANCIEKALSCVDGELGDGGKGKRPAGFNFDPKPRVAPAT